MKERYRSLVAVYAMVVNDRKEILLLRRMNTGYRDGFYDMPAGHLEEGETLREGTIRELEEETGLKAAILKKGRLFQKGDRKLGKTWTIMPFLCSVKSNKVKLCHENAEFRWIECKDLGNYPAVPGLEKDLKVLGLI